MTEHGEYFNLSHAAEVSVQHGLSSNAAQVVRLAEAGIDPAVTLN